MQDITFDFSTLDTLEEIPETSADIEVPDEVLSGPETAEDNGIANLLLDAISNSTDTIQMYNAIIANTTDENLIDELNEILVDENRTMGKLQALLQNVSPNAEEIMNGAIEIQGVEDSPVDESLDEDVNNRKVYVVEPHKIDVDLYDIVFIDNGERASSKRFESYEDAVRFIKKNAKYNNWIAGDKADFQSKEDKLTDFGKRIKSSKINESLNEAANNRVTLFCTFEPYERYVSRSGLKKLKASGKDYLEAISKLTDKMGLYIDSDRIEEDGMTFDEVIDSIEMSNGDGCDYIVELKDNQGNVYIQAEYENDYEDVDESLNESDRPDGAPINFWEPGGEDAEEYYQTNILTDMFDADPSRFEQALRDFGYNPTNYDNFDSFLKDVDKVDLLNKFADLLQKNDELNSSWYDHFDFTESPLPFELDESLILDENNNLDTALDDVTPVRDVHNERAIRDHKKAKEDRKKAMKEISKTIKDAIELEESLFEDAQDEVSLRKKLYEYLDSHLNDTFEDALAAIISSEIPEYEADWCGQDMSSNVGRKYDQVRNQFLITLIDVLLEDY